MVTGGATTTEPGPPSTEGLIVAVLLTTVPAGTVIFTGPRKVRVRVPGVAPLAAGTLSPVQVIVLEALS